MKRIEIKPGQKFNLYTVIKEVEKKNGYRYFYCLCECGNKKEVRLSALRNETIKSCGCLRNEQNRTANLKHGLYDSRIYRIYRGMLQRCNNPKNAAYNDYGGRGINVCEDWEEDFMSFYHWAMNNGYNDNLSIERKNVDEGYSPSNCEWATVYKQSNNKRNTKRYTYKGVEKSLKEWSDDLKIPYRFLKKRLGLGWSFDEAVEVEKGGKRHDKV